MNSIKLFFKHLWSAALYAVLLFTAVLISALPFFSQDIFAEKPDQKADTKIDLKFIQLRISQTESDAGMDESVKNKIMTLYHEAMADIKEADQLKIQRDIFSGQNKNAPSELKELKAFLGKPAMTVPPAIPKNASRADIEKYLSNAEAELQTTRNALKKSEDDLKRRGTSVIELPKQIALLRQELEGIKSRLQGFEFREISDNIDMAENIRLRARSELLNVKIEALEAERLFYDGNGELLTARRDKAARDVEKAEKMISEYRKVMVERQVEDARSAEREAVKAGEGISDLHPELRGIAEENAELARELVDLKSKINKSAERYQEVQKILTFVENEFANTLEQTNVSKFSSNFGILVRNQRTALPDIHIHRQEKKRRQNEISVTQLRSIELQMQRSALAAMESSIQATLQELSIKDPKEIARSEEILKKMLRQQRSLLFELWDDCNNLLKNLVALDIRQGMLIEKTEEYTRFIDERILLTRSRRVLSFTDMKDAAKGIIWFADSSGWSQVYSTLETIVQARWIEVIIFILIFAFLMKLRPLAKKGIKSIGENIEKMLTNSFRQTILSALYTLILTLTCPLLIWMIGLEMAALDIGDFARNMGTGLYKTAEIYFFLLLLYNLCCEKGIAHVHFKWPHGIVMLLRKNLFRLMCAGLPMLFISRMTETMPFDIRKECLGLIAFFAVMAVFSVFFHKILSPAKGIFKELESRNYIIGLRRWRYVLYAAGVFGPLILIFITAFGYYYTANRLASGLYATGIVITSAIILYSFAVRWMTLMRHKIALEQIEQSYAQSFSEKNEGESSPVQDAPINLPQISLQTRRLIVSILCFGAVILIWIIWEDELPALNMLKEVKLWSDAITLADLGLAFGAGFMTFIAGRNIPGLLDIGILQHLSLDSGTGYAIKTLSQYLIVVLGGTAVFSIIGLKWSEIQWIVAAMTFGIGFGLQEIFANFISGLIILFERPIKVGDTVTIGGTSGTVTRIRIRATTIMDWNEKELIIPNKNFVTGEIVNWTHTNQILRIIIPVGIAYGSDTREAERILKEIALKNTLILKEPNPRIVFTGFGDSALNFELRVYIKSISDWVSALDSLNHEIDAAFREAEIEIAFPQRDLHLRSVDPKIFKDVRIS